MSRISQVPSMLGLQGLTTSCIYFQNVEKHVSEKDNFSHLWFALFVCLGFFAIILTYRSSLLWWQRKAYIYKLTGTEFLTAPPSWKGGEGCRDRTRSSPDPSQLCARSEPRAPASRSSWPAANHTQWEVRVGGGSFLNSVKSWRNPRTGGDGRKASVEKKSQESHVCRSVFVFNLLISSLEFVLYTCSNLVYLG